MIYRSGLLIDAIVPVTPPPSQNDMSAIMQPSKDMVVTKASGNFLLATVTQVNNAVGDVSYFWSYALYHDNGLSFVSGTDKSSGVLAHFENIPVGYSGRIGAAVRLYDSSNPKKTCVATVKGKPSAINFYITVTRPQ